MYKKIIAMLLMVIMTVTLVACGGSPKAETTNQTETTSSTSEEQVSGETDAGVENTETEAAGNMFSLCYEISDRNKSRSAVITYDPEKVELIGLYYNSAEFELVEDYDVTLWLGCEYENSSVQDLYNREMESYLKDDSFTVTELAETAIGDLTVWRSDAVWKESGEIAQELFIMELGNGLLLYSMHFPGYEDTFTPETELVYLEELLPYVLVDVAEGDGTCIIPTLAYDFKADEDVLTLSFVSGESFAFDYDQNALEVGTGGLSVYVNCLGKQDYYGIELNVTNNFNSSAEFFEHQITYGLLETTEFAGDGKNFATVSVGRYDDGEDLCYIDLGNSYGLYGSYRAENNGGRPVEEILTALLGSLETVVVPEAPVEGASLWFDYNAPTSLEDSISSMVYQMDSVLYRFPTPLSEFLANGWSLGVEWEEIYPEEDAIFSLVSGDGSSEVYVTVHNGTSEPIPIEEGLVTQMEIRNGDAELILPEVSRDGAPTSVFHSAIVFPALQELGTHSSEERTTLIWSGEDGRSKLAVVCYGTDEYGEVKRVTFSYE